MTIRRIYLLLSLIFITLGNTIIPDLLSNEDTIVFAARVPISSSGETAQIISMPTTSVMADGIDNSDNTNPNLKATVQTISTAATV
jgi:hypothetical protein